MVCDEDVKTQEEIEEIILAAFCNQQPHCIPWFSLCQNFHIQNLIFGVSHYYITLYKNK